MAIMKVKPWGKDQGDYVIIEEENFDPDFHEVFDSLENDLFDDQPKKRGRKPKALENEGLI